MSEASELVATSVDDMQASLGCAEANGRLDLAVLRKAKALAERRGEKTKALILGRYIRRISPRCEMLWGFENPCTNEARAKIEVSFAGGGKKKIYICAECQKKYLGGCAQRVMCNI